MNFRIEAACGSNVGRVRRNNEDNFLFDGNFLPQRNDGQTPPLQLYGDFEGPVYLAVFDGMGGMDYGEVAAATAAETAARLTREEALPPEALCAQLNRAVWDAQGQLGTHNVGTTLAMLCLEKDTALAVNIGDSRIFGLRGDQLVQISRDHTDEAYMKEKGITGRKPRLTQYLGMDPGQVLLEPYTARGALETGDTYLICSDGLTDMLDTDTIRHLLTVSGTAAACVEQLIAAALEQGGRDNVTVIVCRILEQTENGRTEYDTNGDQSPLARLGSLGLSWGRKLWSSIQDTAKHIRRN